MEVKCEYLPRLMFEVYTDATKEVHAHFIVCFDSNDGTNELVGHFFGFMDLSIVNSLIHDWWYKKDNHFYKLMNADELVDYVLTQKMDTTITFSTEWDEDEEVDSAQVDPSAWHGIIRTKLMDCELLIASMFGGGYQFIATLQDVTQMEEDIEYTKQELAAHFKDNDLENSSGQVLVELL